MLAFINVGFKNFFKMKNLENYGVQELDAMEARSVDGGIFGIDDLIIGALLGWAMSQDLDDLGDAFNHGYDLYQS